MRVLARRFEGEIISVQKRVNQDNEVDIINNRQKGRERNDVQSSGNGFNDLQRKASQLYWLSSTSSLNNPKGALQHRVKVSLSTFRFIRAVLFGVDGWKAAGGRGEPFLRRIVLYFHKLMTFVLQITIAKATNSELIDRRAIFT